MRRATEVRARGDDYGLAYAETGKVGVEIDRRGRRLYANQLIPGKVPYASCNSSQSKPVLASQP